MGFDFRVAGVLMGTFKVAVIGAGVAGLTCAKRLHSEGAEVTVFEKSRGPGGRVSTRREEGGSSFDHGAQYFTIKSRGFEREVSLWESAGAVAKWPGRVGVLKDGNITSEVPMRPRWVGTPGMSAIGRHLAQGLNLITRARVVELLKNGSKWQLQLEGQGLSTKFDAVVISCPGPQAVRLLPEGTVSSRLASGLDYSPCWAGMAHFRSPLFEEYDAFRSKEGAIGWCCREVSKPGRAEGERWVLHASPAWSRKALEFERHEVEAAFSDFCETLFSVRPESITAHRWRFALADRPAQSHPPAVFEPDFGIGLCGDGLVSPRIEGAWLSGVAIAGELMSWRAALCV